MEVQVLHTHLGSVYEAKNQSNDALSEYGIAEDILKQQIKGNENDADPWRRLIYVEQHIADLRAAQADTEGAIKEWQEQQLSYGILLKSDPRNGGLISGLARNHESIAEIRETQGDLSAAVLEFEAALDISNSPAESANLALQSEIAANISWINILKHQADDSISRLEEAASSNYGDLRLQSRLAAAYLISGDADNARNIYTTHQNQTAPSGTSFKDVVEADFTELRKYGIDLPEMREIEAMLAN